MTLGRTGHIRVGVCLSLSGKFARFGQQAGHALETWRRLDGAAELLVEDDRSDTETFRKVISDVAARCDVLLGPYSTQLMRLAGRAAAEADWLIWNHGGSGDDVESATPGHVVSVLTPTSRYAEPYVRLLAHEHRTQLWIAEGKGSFGKQVASGAAAAARQFGIDAVCIHPSDIAAASPPNDWSLFSAGTFENDVDVARHVLALSGPPRRFCAVAAGITEFAAFIDEPEGVFGVGQWAPGAGDVAQLGPSEADFASAYIAATGQIPDYPAVQAAAAAALAAHCARQANGLTRDLLWEAVSQLDTSTLFGPFKIDPTTGVQLKHEAVLTQWKHGQLTLTDAEDAGRTCT